MFDRLLKTDGYSQIQKGMEFGSRFYWLEPARRELRVRALKFINIRVL